MCHYRALTAGFNMPIDIHALGMVALTRDVVSGESPHMSTEMFSLAGKRALVTGASRGIGRAIAEGLARAGADVALAARKVESLDACANVITGLGRRVACVAMDVSDVANCRQGVQGAALALGGLDILVNNAGIEQVCPSLDVEEELWDRILDTNLKGAFFAAQAAARVMNGGTILNICSLTSERGIPTAVPYGCSKSGLAGMTRALATEWAPLGIRVNALEPGYFRTNLTEVFYQTPAWQEAMLAKVPMKRFGEMNDLVGASIFLCSDAASYITGICLPVDGGTLASI
jgi:NAD(P)-dependent dehydrogenase (short-subunit alcohol dehydrogenase family)